MKGFDLNSPFFIPLYRRVIVVVLALGWAGVELATGAPFWGMLFGAMGLYAAYGFFVTFDPGKPEE